MEENFRIFFFNERIFASKETNTIALEVDLFRLTSMPMYA